MLSKIFRDNRFCYIVVDTPPTGVTLRTLYLPQIYIVWLSKLIEVRERIVSLRYVIARVLGREKEVRDKVLTKLYELKSEYTELWNMLRDSAKTWYIVVATPEPLPMYELESTVNFLRSRLGVEPKMLILNRVLREELAKQMGVDKHQMEYINRLRSMGIPAIAIEYLGKPTKSLDDVLELEKHIVVVAQ